MEQRPFHSHKPTPVSLLNLGTAVLIVGWLTVASYAIAYLISR